MRGIGLGAAALALLLAAGPGMAEQGKGHSHQHGHDHSQGDPQQAQIAKGYFEDAQVADRPLSDWEGDWQSVYPLLLDGTLDPVMAHKAKHGDKTAAEYKAYYEAGYRSDVERIEIHGDTVSFHAGDKVLTGQYASDGHEILTYAKGNRGVRFIFRKVSGDAGAPGWFQFSDHKIAPAKADHFHLYMGDDRAKLLDEVTNWPTYYPAALTPAQIARDMQAH